MELPRAVLFDLDGTIVDNTDVIVDIYKRGLIALGMEPPSDEHIAKQGGKSTFDTAKALGVPEQSRAFIDQFFWKESSRIFSSEYSVDFKKNLISGIEELLSTLFRLGIPIGLVTSNTKKNAESILKVSCLHKYFSAFVGKDEVNEMKPSPEPVYTALRELGLSSAQGVWYIGDSPSDMISSQAAGALSILIGKNKATADLKVKDHREIVKILRDIISDPSLRENA